MKVKDLIKELNNMDPEADARVCVYDCGGFDDSHEISDVEVNKGESWNIVQLEISVGCSTHRKWITEGNCPVESLKKESKKIEDLKRTLDYYQKRFDTLQATWESKVNKAT